MNLPSSSPELSSTRRYVPRGRTFHLQSDDYQPLILRSGSVIWPIHYNAIEGRTRVAFRTPFLNDPQQGSYVGGPNMLNALPMDRRDSDPPNQLSHERQTAFSLAYCVPSAREAINHLLGLRLFAPEDLFRNTDSASQRLILVALSRFLLTQTLLPREQFDRMAEWVIDSQRLPFSPRMACFRGLKPEELNRIFQATLSPRSH
ncbi:hypothetical protein IPJ72_02165 [Candidatus Peregrinibacteria bacterium]|nr:MAG: hypothetical protein IPJ72_02165 [Candidatus Peregrinibacteria bacterium]